MLDIDIKDQLTEYLKLLQDDILIQMQTDSEDSSVETREFIEEIASMTDKIHIEEGSLLRTPSFSLSRIGEPSRIQFAGVPLGHEFTSFVLALLQVSGRPPKADESVIRQIRALKGTYSFTTYMSLSCHNCPDVVQALNLMSVLHPNISNVTVNGANFQSELTEKDILAVPAVFLNEKLFISGRSSLLDILTKLQELEGTQEPASSYLPDKNETPFDVVVVGGGPAGSSAAVYAARKGIRTAMIAEDFGGQVKDTVGIENLIGTLYTTGAHLAEDLKSHVNSYPVEMITGSVTEITTSAPFEIQLNNRRRITAKTIILATGAKWRNINVPGESKFRSKGVAYCPHCDGPLFAGQRVAVVGGGNSGIEAAIDLAGIANEVTVLEFLPELKADKVLIEKAASLSNIMIHKNVATKEITGENKVTGITYQDRENQAEHHIDLEGVFVQIGLSANTSWLKETVEKNKIGEIIVDEKQATSVPGIFAAGDCTNAPYKQIIISMGSGATAALSAFDFLIRS